LPYTAPAVLEVTAPHMRLKAVVDRGKTYDPPPGPCLLPLNAGMLALSKLDAIVKEAEAFVR